MYICLFLIPVIFLVIAILLWYKFGRDDQVIETVEFYPPEGLNSLELKVNTNEDKLNLDYILEDDSSNIEVLGNKNFVFIFKLALRN